MLNFGSILKKGIPYMLLVISLAGCNLIKLIQSNDSEVPESNTQSESEMPKPLAEEEEAELDFVSCPVEGETLFLAFDHSLTIEMSDVNLTHILQNKWIYLYVDGVNADGTTALSSGSPVELTYEMLGVMADCSVEMEGVMLASASGTCQDGVVYLDIIEDWQPASGQMVCDDSTIPFQSPGQAYEHTGDNGLGEQFYLVSGSEGYATMRPFQAGSGYHTWTLYSQLVEAVPLVQ